MKDFGQPSSEHSENLNLAIHLQSIYFFEEFFLPLISKFHKTSEIIVIVDTSLSHSDIRRMEKWCQEASANCTFLNEQIHSPNKIKNLINIRKIIQICHSVDLLLASNLCSPEMRFLRTELLSKGIPSIFVQASGLHHDFWEKFGSRSTFISNGGLKETKRSKVLNFKKYPNYFGFISRRFKSYVSDIPFRFIFCFIFQGRFYPRTPFERFPYISNQGEKMLVIFEPDAELLNNVFEESTAQVVMPPYFDKGNKKQERDLLLCVPGPLLETGQRESLKSLFQVFNAICSQEDVDRVMIRLHPRETNESRKAIWQIAAKFIGNRAVLDVSGEDLWPILRRCKIVIGGVSNTLSVARASSETRRVIGVLNSGLTGVMGSNIQYQNTPDIMWLDSVDKIDWRYLSKHKHVQTNKIHPRIDQIILKMVTENKLNAALIDNIERCGKK